MSHLAAWIHTPIAQALGWTLVHFVWEGAVLAGALMALLWLLLEAPARRRYALACFVLAAMPVVFAVTFAVIWARRPIAIAAPIYWAPVALSADPIALPPPRFSWAGLLNRLAWLVPVWFAGVAFFYARGVAGWIAVRRLRHRGVCAPPPEWQVRLDELAARLRLSRPVALLESCFTDTPVLIGYLRPVILLPLGCLTGLSVAQVECILLHELAHVARHDYLVNLLQSLAEGLLFYHPAVWWVSRVVRAERENCCDDRVVELMGNARAYAATLAVLEQRRSLAPQAALAATGGNLMLRIRRLTRESRGAQPSVAPGASAAVLLVVFAAALTALPAKLPLRHSHAPMPLAVAAATPQEPSTPYQKWLTEDVAYIVTDQEREAFLQLTSDAEREKFIEQFWLVRDPTPGTERNEYREEHYRRVAYSNEHFAGSVAGWRTDRGRTYIQYGPPDEIDDHSSGGSYQRPAEEGGGEVQTFPFQQWRYRLIDGIGNNVIMEFVDRFGAGDFALTNDPGAKEKTPYAQWLAQDVAAIVTPAERAEFQKLTTDQEREKFIEQFWQRRGPAARTEHYRRIAYANEHFHVAGSAAPGWTTDLGRAYIVWGPPDEIQSANAYEISWTYRHAVRAGASITMVFKDSQMNGQFHVVGGYGKEDPPKEDQDAKVFASNGPAAVSVIVPRKGQQVAQGVIGIGDVLEVSYVASSNDIDRVISAKTVECAALSRRYQPDYPDVVACNDQVRALEQHRPETAAVQRLTELKGQEVSIRSKIAVSVRQVDFLEQQLAEASKELKAVQERVSASPKTIQMYNQLQQDLAMAKDTYEKLAAKESTGSLFDSLLKEAKTKMELKQLALAAFTSQNQEQLPENFQANMQEVQTHQVDIGRLEQQIAQIRTSQILLESELDKNKSLQAQNQARLTQVPAGTQQQSRVTVNNEGRMALGGRDFAAAGLTPAQLSAAIGAGSSVQIEQSASQTVTVLVPLNARDHLHISGEVTASQIVVQSFDSEATGQPALAKAIALRAGSYHLVVVVKNAANGAIHRSTLDFTVD